MKVEEAVVEVEEAEAEEAEAEEAVVEVEVHPHIHKTHSTYPVHQI
jgi:hypothetical protein